MAGPTSSLDDTPRAGQSRPEIAEIKAAASVLVERVQWMKQHGISFGGLRDLYEVLGYDRIITPRQYRERYRRGGIAGRVVDALPKATWRGTVELIEDENPKTDTVFEQAWTELDQRLSICPTLQRADILSAQGRYAVVLLGTAGQSLSDPLKKGKPDDLIYLSPFSEEEAIIQQWEVDISSPRFGMPSFYQLRRLGTTSDSSATPVFSSIALQLPVHWSRVIHIAEGCLENDVFGQPALERVWNLLDDLDKVTGGGAEAFWLRANQGTHVNIDKDMKLAPDELTHLQQQAEDYQHGIRRFMRTKGVNIDTLGSDVANFSNPADAILTQIAGAKSIPKRILTGSEMGELASSQDRDNWKDQINGRQTGYAGPYILRRLVDRLIEYGYLPTPKQYEVRWPHIQTLTEQEKADGAAKWASVNATYGKEVFTSDEIRDKWYGLEPDKGVDTEAWRADLALKMASTNKTEGATIFTDDEIRKTAYGWEPLAPEQKVPITAPERVSANAPTPQADQVGGQGAPAKGAKPVDPNAAPNAMPKAAESIEQMVTTLERAIVTNDVETLDRMLGIHRAPR